jgi:hypothetical protein
MQDPQCPLPLRGRMIEMRGCPPWLAVIIFLFLSQATRAFAQSNQAIVVDGSGPWQNDQWNFTVAQFNSRLTDAGYTVTTVSPADVPSALAAGNMLLAVPSLQSLPFDTLNAIGNFVRSGGGIMASGGEPFQDPLYLAPNGSYLDAAAYQAAVGSPPPQGPFFIPIIPTLSPWSAQYTTSSGPRVPIVQQRGIAACGNNPRTRVIGDILAPAATIYSFFQSFLPPPGFTGPSSVMQNFIVWLSWPQISDSDRAQLVAALQAAISGAHLQCAGPSQMVWLPGETITASANAVNMSSSAVQATLQWSIVGSVGAMPQPSFPMPMAATGGSNVNLNIPTLPTGDYTLSF